MPAPNNGNCPYCKGTKTLYLLETKGYKEIWQCSKCKERVTK